ncbi:MAG: glycerol-3-phosphate acyltransferase ['Candidatus Kapabacteria' thiocyanatum]|uniref:Glycerol-3-phosphate acyltransferase n=1 Tax=Candidatus Kapaibacterium thiocyanatum TaxID=1895771 RepID=A0A1M3KW65_9BACT|nr:glycerol-3-phosphate acyltransferase ['Candidatus Kapabacteria' thiocyanatum]OJX56652.1 MAG: hypothetical protein BGO89_08885 ['Candidatus Kapabacteria' thiocyanatum]
MNIGLLPGLLIAYVIGMIPTAYLVLKFSHGKDIRQEGTGNVGAMNTYDVTGSRWLGIITFVIDALKGVLAVCVAQWIYGDWFLAKAVMGTAVIGGHNFNLLLKGKGGRGLSTATGVFAVVNPFVILLWDLMYLTGYFAIKRNQHVGNVVGTIGLAVLIFSTPERVLRMTTLVTMDNPTELKLFVFASCVVIFLRHIGPMRELVAAASREEDQD